MLPPAAAAEGQQPPCWYAVLGVPPGASSDTIKQAFRAAALRLHPDKAAAVNAAGGGGAGAAAASAAAAEEFLLVQQAWEVLQDAGRRAAYDRQLALSAAAADVHVDETVALGDLQPEAVDGQACWAWPCRCGGCYLLLAEDAEALVPPQGAAAEDVAAEAAASELIVPCSTCSLHIRVLAEQLRPAQ